MRSYFQGRAGRGNRETEHPRGIPLCSEAACLQVFSLRRPIQAGSSLFPMVTWGPSGPCRSWPGSAGATTKMGLSLHSFERYLRGLRTGVSRRPSFYRPVMGLLSGKIPKTLSGWPISRPQADWATETATTNASGCARLCSIKTSHVASGFSLTEPGPGTMCTASIGTGGPGGGQDLIPRLMGIQA